MQWVQFNKKLSSAFGRPGSSFSAMKSPVHDIRRPDIKRRPAWPPTPFWPRTARTEKKRDTFIQPCPACDPRRKLVISHLEQELWVTKRQSDGCMFKRKLSDCRFSEVAHGDGRSLRISESPRLFAV